METDHTYMLAAMEEAKAAQDRDEVPIGAVITHEGEIIAAAGNRTRELNDPTAHAEILAIREACEKGGAQRIPGMDLYVTLEPCTMCAAAISFARINRVIIAAPDEKGGGILYGAKFYDQPTCHHRPQITQGPMAADCATILKNFFKEKRKK